MATAGGKRCRGDGINASSGEKVLKRVRINEESRSVTVNYQNEDMKENQEENQDESKGPTL